MRRVGGLQVPHLNWSAVAIAVVAAVAIGASGVEARHLMNATAPRPLPGITTQIKAQPLPTSDPTVGPGTAATALALPDHVLLQVPFTTQAPLNNWAQHQESCEAANLTMLI